MENVKYIMLLLGMAVGIPLIWNRKKVLGLKNLWQVFLVCLGFSVCSLFAASGFASLENLISGNGLKFGSISTYGVYLFCPIVICLVARRSGGDGRRWMDVFSLYALPSLFFMRCNCLACGCCGGKVIGGTGLHWPTRQVEMIFYVVMLLVLLRREKTGMPAGTAFPLLAASYGAFRFVVEWFRDASGGSFIHLAHVWSVLAFIIGFGLYSELSNSPLKKSGLRKERGVSKC